MKNPRLRSKILGATSLVALLIVSITYFYFLPRIESLYASAEVQLSFAIAPGLLWGVASIFYVVLVIFAFFVDNFKEWINRDSQKSKIAFFILNFLQALVAFIIVTSIRAPLFQLSDLI